MLSLVLKPPSLSMEDCSETLGYWSGSTSSKNFEAGEGKSEGKYRNACVYTHRHTHMGRGVERERGCRGKRRELLLVSLLISTLIALQGLHPQNIVSP